MLAQFRDPVFDGFTHDTAEATKADELSTMSLYAVALFDLEAALRRGFIGRFG